MKDLEQTKELFLKHPISLCCDVFAILATFVGPEYIYGVLLLYRELSFAVLVHGVGSDNKFLSNL